MEKILAAYGFNLGQLQEIANLLDRMAKCGKNRHHHASHHKPGNIVERSFRMILMDLVEIKGANRKVCLR